MASMLTLVQQSSIEPEAARTSALLCSLSALSTGDCMLWEATVALGG